MSILLELGEIKLKTRKLFFIFTIVILLSGLTNRGLGKSTDLQAVNEPDFSVIASSLTPSGQGVYEFSVTVNNTGNAATVGEVPISWERNMHNISMINGNGILNESAVDLDMDLNGDGDKLDSFTVTWFDNDTRDWDAIINNGTHDIHAYSFNEGPFVLPLNRTYYINGKPKIFQLGSENHSLYWARSDAASFGLGDTVILSHPSPNFELAVDVNMGVTNIKINGAPVEVNHSWTGIDWGREELIYIVPNIASEIGVGEQTTFSCTLIPPETKTTQILFLINWSPDGHNIRRIWVPVDEFFSVVAQTTTTTTPTTTTTSTQTTTTTTEDTPGFSFLILLLLIPCLTYTKRRKKV